MGCREASSLAGSLRASLGAKANRFFVVELPKLPCAEPKQKVKKQNGKI
jgi:hypothetical protein